MHQTERGTKNKASPFSSLLAKLRFTRLAQARTVAHQSDDVFDIRFDHDHAQTLIIQV